MEFQGPLQNRQSWIAKNIAKMQAKSQAKAEAKAAKTAHTIAALPQPPTENRVIQTQTKQNHQPYNQTRAEHSIQRSG